MVSQGEQGFWDVNPVNLVLDCFQPVWIRLDILDGFHARERVFDETVKVSEIPGRSTLLNLLLY